MFTLEDLKNSRKEVIEKLTAECGRDEALRLCSEVLDKRAYFTVDMNGSINRKRCGYIIPAGVYVEDDGRFTNYVAENLDFSEKIKIDKINRMANETVENLKKNIFKLFAKGDCRFSARYCKELYFKNKDEFFKLMFHYSLMDNMSFEKPLMIYSLRKYFEKFGYSDNIFYLVISYFAKMRSDFSSYENASQKNIFSKKELREKFRNNIERYENRKGFELLCYLLVLFDFDYAEEEKFINIAAERMSQLENSEDEKLSDIPAEIFKNLLKEV